jgi:tRNA-dihydrouridine synthase 3
MRFLPWHLGFFCRYRPLSGDRWEAASREHPLIQTRMPDDEPDLPLLERLLRDPRPDVHQRLADLLWESADVDEAERRALQLAAEMPPMAGDAGEVATAHG